MCSVGEAPGMSLGTPGLEVFGLCCVHISFELHQSSFGSGPRPIF